jgi:outer membrane protein
MYGQTQYTLKECIEQAWGNNLLIKQSALNLESAASQLKSTQANVLPSVNGFASHNYNWGQRIDPFTNQFATTRVQSNSFGLAANVDLFNGLQNYQSIKSQEAGLESSRYDLETQKNEIALQVSQAFLQVLMIDELIASADQQIIITNRQLDRIKKLVEAGSVNIGAQYELEAQLARDKNTLTQRNNDYALAMLQLKQLMLIPADQVIALKVPNSEVEEGVLIENTDVVYSYASSAMPEVKRAEYALISWERQLNAAKSGWYPSLSLAGSIGSGYSGLRNEVTSITPVTETIGFTASGEDVFTQSFNATFDRVPFITQIDDNFNQFLGLSLNVPIFNRYQVQNNVNQAKINRSIAEIQVEQEKLVLRQRIESARTDAVAGRDAYIASLESLKASQKAFEFSEKRFEAGAINSMEFNNAKNNLMIAEAEVSRSRYDYLFRLKVLDFFMGKPLAAQD